MAKKDISKILSTGSIKQRLLLASENRAREVYGKELLLTKAEYNQIANSCIKAKEISLWNEWLQHSRIIVDAIDNLQGLLFEVKMNYSNLRGYILVWNSVENSELLVNSVLHEIKDPTERMRIAKVGAERVKLLFTKTILDKEGYIDIKTDFKKETGEDNKYSLFYVMNNVKQEATTSAIKFISWREAMLDYMDEVGFNVKTYKDIIKGFTEQVEAPIIHWPKYNSDSKTFIEDMPSPAVDKLKSKYAITPIISELEVDEVIYNQFKNSFLTNG